MTGIINNRSTSSKHSDLVSSSADRKDAGSALVGTERSDAVNSGIVGRAHRSDEVLKKDLYDTGKKSSKTGTSTSKGGSAVARNKEDGLSSVKGSSHKEVPSSTGTSGGATDALKSKTYAGAASGGAKAGDVVKSNASGKGLPSGEGLVGTFARNLDSEEFDGFSKITEGSMSARRAYKQVKKKVAEKGSQNSGLGQLTEKKHTQQKSAQAIRRAEQTNRNQRVSRSIAKGGKKLAPAKGVKALKSSKAVAGGAKAGKAGGGAAAAGGAVAAIKILLVLIAVIFVVMLITLAASSDTVPDIEGLEGNEAIIAQFLLDNDFGPLHTAAIMGNLYAESKYDPTLAELFDAGSAEFSSAGQGRGIAQWSFYPGRRQQLYNFTDFDGNREALNASRSRNNRNGSWVNLNKQLEFLLAEMTRQGPAVAYTNDQWLTGSLEGFLAIDDLNAATTYFGVRFLRHSATANRDDQYTEASRIFSILVAGDGAAVMGEMTWPVPGFYRISSPFGPRPSPGGIGSTFHCGIDIAGAGIHGASVVAAAPGIVSMTRTGGGYGHRIEINHGNGVITRYAHLSSIDVREGQLVAAGQHIGRVGSTGASTGPHLHFHIIANGNTVDPLPWLRR